MAALAREYAKFKFILFVFVQRVKTNIAGRVTNL